MNALEQAKNVLVQYEQHGTAATKITSWKLVAEQAKAFTDLAEAAQAVVDCRNASGSGNVRTYASFNEALDKLAAVLGGL